MPHRALIAQFRTRQAALRALRSYKRRLDKQRCPNYGGGRMQPIEAQREAEATAKRIRLIESLGK